MKALSTDTLLARLLYGGWRWRSFAIRIGFCGPKSSWLFASVIFTIGFLKFDPDQNNLVAPNLKYQQNFLRLQKRISPAGQRLGRGAKR
jgi:hypothetical protein